MIEKVIVMYFYSFSMPFYMTAIHIKKHIESSRTGMKYKLNITTVVRPAVSVIGFLKSGRLFTFLVYTFMESKTVRSGEKEVHSRGDPLSMRRFFSDIHKRCVENAEEHHHTGTPVSRMQ